MELLQRATQDEQASLQASCAQAGRRPQFRLGGCAMRWVVAMGLGLLFALPAGASEARAVIPVTVRVVHPAKVVMTATSSSAATVRTDSGGTEFRVDLHASVSGRETKNIQLNVRDCEGAHAEWTSAPGDPEREVRLVLPAGSSCEPVVVATVEADGAR